MGKTERKRIAFFLVCIMLLGMFGNIFVAFAESGDGSAVEDNSEVIMMDARSTSGGAITAPTTSGGATATPSTDPSTVPSIDPSTAPSIDPSTAPSIDPSTAPSIDPSTAPSIDPSTAPSTDPSTAPSTDPSIAPSTDPSTEPSTEPSTNPSTEPSTNPSTAPPTETPVPSSSPVPTILPDPPIGIVTGPSITEPTAEPSADPVKKKLTILLGKSFSFDKLFKDKSAVKKLDKVTLKNPGKYRKYFQIKLKKGKIVTKQNYAVKIKKKIKIYVTLKGKEQSYPVLVTLKIPKPKVKIRVKKYNYFGGQGYDFIFHYNIPKAKKIQVRLAKGGSKEINRYLDKYISGRKSNKSAHIIITKNSFKKKKEITFRIVAYYGRAKNKSEVLKITKKVK